MPLARIHGLHGRSHGCCSKGCSLGRGIRGPLRGPGPYGCVPGLGAYATRPDEAARARPRVQGFDAAAPRNRPLRGRAEPRVPVPPCCLLPGMRPDDGGRAHGRRRSRAGSAASRAPAQLLGPNSLAHCCPTQRTHCCPASDGEGAGAVDTEPKRRPQVPRPRRTPIGCRPSYRGPASSSRSGRPSLPYYVRPNCSPYGPTTSSVARRRIRTTTTRRRRRRRVRRRRLNQQRTSTISATWRRRN